MALGLVNTPHRLTWHPDIRPARSHLQNSSGLFHSDSPTAVVYTHQSLQGPLPQKRRQDNETKIFQSVAPAQHRKRGPKCLTTNAPRFSKSKNQQAAKQKEACPPPTTPTGHRGPPTETGICDEGG